MPSCPNGKHPGKTYFSHNGHIVCEACDPESMAPIGANDRQVGGEHYRTETRYGLQHWDVVDIFGLDYFQGNITKYVFRWRKKGGVEDLKKARHYLDKYIEMAEKHGVGPTPPKG